MRRAHTKPTMATQADKDAYLIRELWLTSTLKNIKDIKDIRENYLAICTYLPGLYLPKLHIVDNLFYIVFTRF